jgi:hypothetical protein
MPEDTCHSPRPIPDARVGHPGRRARPPCPSRLRERRGWRDGRDRPASPPASTSGRGSASDGNLRRSVAGTGRRVQGTDSCSCRSSQRGHCTASLGGARNRPATCPALTGRFVVAVRRRHRSAGVRKRNALYGLLAGKEWSPDEKEYLWVSLGDPQNMHGAGTRQGSPDYTKIVPLFNARFSPRSYSSIQEMGSKVRAARVAVHSL